MDPFNLALRFLDGFAPLLGHDIAATEIVQRHINDERLSEEQRSYLQTRFITIISKVVEVQSKAHDVHQVQESVELFETTHSEETSGAKLESEYNAILLELQASTPESRSKMT
jgi:hypothetical protein